MSLKLYAKDSENEVCCSFTLQDSTIYKNSIQTTALQLLGDNLLVKLFNSALQI